METAWLFEARVLQTGSLSNPTLTWGQFYQLWFHKTGLGSLCVLSCLLNKNCKKKKKNFRHFQVQIWEILVSSFLSTGARDYPLSPCSDWNIICSLWWTWSWPFKKKNSRHFGFGSEKLWFLPEYWRSRKSLSPSLDTICSPWQIHFDISKTRGSHLMDAIPSICV